MSVQVLSCGIDTLVLNVLPTDTSYQVKRRRLDEGLQAELDAYKLQAQEQEEPVPTRWVFEGVTLMMREKGGSHFKWILEHPAFSLAIARGVKVLMLGQVRFSSEYLWSTCQRLTLPNGETVALQDAGQAVAAVHVFLQQFYGSHFTLQVSALDLAADVAGWDIAERNVKDCFITRATFDDERPSAFPVSAPALGTAASSSPPWAADGFVDGPDSIKRRWRRVTGLPFGQRNGAISALLYDKTYEIAYHCKEKRWFHDIWRFCRAADGSPVWDETGPVWRIEMRFKRAALVEGGIEDVYDAFDRLAGIWAYAVGHVGGGDDGLPDGWLRYVVPATDTNRSRWPVHPDWHTIQGAFADALAAERAAVPVTVVPGAISAVSATSLFPAVPTVDEERMARAAAVGPAPAPLSIKPFIRLRKREVNMERAVAAVSGWCATVEAWRCVPALLDEQIAQMAGLPVADRGHDEPDVSVTLHFLHEEVTAYLQAKKRDYAEAVQQKRVRYHLAAAAA